MSDPIGYEFGGTDEGSHYDYSAQQALRKHIEQIGQEDSVASREALDIEARDRAETEQAIDARMKAQIGNGAQEGFTTGATRSTSEGKVDFEGHINPEVLAIYGDYMHRHRVQRNGKLRASDNWQQGIPLHRYMKSLLRHTFELWRMWRGTGVVNPDSGGFFQFRDVLCAILFNVMGMIYEMNKRSPHDLNAILLTPDLREEIERATRHGDAVKNLGPMQPTQVVEKDTPRACCENPRTCSRLCETRLNYTRQRREETNRRWDCTEGS